MEIKKTPKADLENKKSTWLLVGYVIVLAFMFVAFEWTKRDIKIDTSQAITTAPRSSFDCRNPDNRG